MIHFEDLPLSMQQQIDPSAAELFPPEPKSVKNTLKGKRNKANGARFEDIISVACEYYETKELAKIEKEMEPMKPIRELGKGKFIACYTKRSGVDYKGTLKGGRAVAFEAKHTDTDTMQRTRLEPWQMDYLRQHTKLGAETFVLLSFKMENFYKIPFNKWDNMKQEFGRVSLTEPMIQDYRINYTNKILQFLEIEAVGFHA